MIFGDLVILDADHVEAPYLEKKLRKIYEGEAYKFYRQSDKVPPVIFSIIWRCSGDPEQCVGQREGDDGHPVGTHVLRLDHQVHAAAEDRP